MLPMVAGALGAVILLLVILVIVLLRRRNKRGTLQVLPVVTSRVEPAFLKELGQPIKGYYGTVTRAVYSDPAASGTTHEVAVHKLDSAASTLKQQTFFREAEILSGLSQGSPCPAMLRFFGCAPASPHALLVEEWMSGGTLQAVLRQMRLNSDSVIRIPLPVALQLSLEIVQGLLFLHARGIIHSNLCTGTVLLDRESHCKLTAMGRPVEHAEYVRWQALELISPTMTGNAQGDIHSDVWALGVTVWEILTLASTPYYELTPSQVPSEVQQGKRLDSPAACPVSLSMQLYECWRANKNLRPTVPAFESTLLSLLQPTEYEQPSAGVKEWLAPASHALSDAGRTAEQALLWDSRLYVTDGVSDALTAPGRRNTLFLSIPRNRSATMFQPFADGAGQAPGEAAGPEYETTDGDLHYAIPVEEGSEPLYYDIPTLPVPARPPKPGAATLSSAHNPLHDHPTRATYFDIVPYESDEPLPPIPTKAPARPIDESKL